eukprot:1145349-Pelagomonas_calceolata.AAC.10
MRQATTSGSCGVCLYYMFTYSKSMVAACPSPPNGKPLLLVHNMLVLPFSAKRQATASGSRACKCGVSWMPSLQGHTRATQGAYVCVLSEILAGPHKASDPRWQGSKGKGRSVQDAGPWLCVTS